MSNIIACIDGSHMSLSVCDAAAWAAQKLEAPLLLLHALEKKEKVSSENLSGSIGLGSREKLLDELTALDETHSRLALEHGRLLLDHASERAQQKGVQDILVQQRHGSVLESLKGIQDGIRLVVLGKSGEDHANQDNVIGSNIESVARVLSTPLLITVGDFTPPSQLMIAYDGRETADKALAKIASSPLLKGVTCHLVMVSDDEEQKLKLANAESILSAEGFTVNTTVLSGNVFEQLSQYQQDNGIDMVAMGAYEHSRVRQFFVGSNATKMISASRVPVMILR